MTTTLVVGYAALKTIELSTLFILWKVFRRRFSWKSLGRRFSTAS
jgi:hypothetical protein